MTTASRQPPGRVGGLSAPGVEIGEVRVAEDAAEPLTRQQTGIATSKRRMGDADGVLGHWWK
jgi:hypothetical protein